MKFLIVVGFAALGGALTALRGVRASDEELRAMAEVIGTRNPRLARAVCWAALVSLGPVGVAIIGAYLIFIVRYLLGY